MTRAETFPGNDGSGLAFEDVGQNLDRLVRPHNWQNPQPRAVYDRQKHLETITVPLADMDRSVLSVLDDETEGFLRVHHRRGRLVGCTIVSSLAGDLIGLASNLIGRRANLAELSSTIFPYPTQGEAYRKASDAYRRTRLTPRIRRAFVRYFELSRW